MSAPLLGEKRSQCGGRLEKEVIDMFRGWGDISLDEREGMDVLCRIESAGMVAWVDILNPYLPKSLLQLWYVSMVRYQRVSFGLGELCLSL